MLQMMQQEAEGGNLCGNGPFGLMVLLDLQQCIV